MHTVVDQLPNLDAIFTREGESRAMSYSAPLLLDDPRGVWLVSAGHVDLFITALAFGQPFGLRRFHMRLAKGDLLFGMDVPVAGQSTGFLAAGDATARVERLPIERFAELARGRDGVRRLERWIRMLPNGLTSEVPPPHAHDLAEKKVTLLDADECGRSTQTVLWIRPKGELEPIGIEGARIANEWFPLAAEGWVRAPEKVEVEALSSADYAAASRQLSGLWSFHRVILDAADRLRKREEEAEHQRMVARGRADARSMTATISRLAAVSEAQEMLAETDAQDPFLSACRLVGNAIGIEIRPSPEPKRHRNLDDRLDNIARASRARTRRVVLRPGWWRTDSGPLLAFREDGRPLAMLPIAPGKYERFDPVDATRLRVDERVAETIGPFAFTFYRPFAARVLELSDIVRLALSGSKRDLTAVVAIGAIGGAFELMLPLATGQVFDRIIPSADRNMLLQMTLAIIALAIANMMLSFSRGVAMLRAETRMSSSVQAGVWDRLLSLPVPFFRRFSSGDLAVRANGIDAIRSALSGTAMTSLLSAIFAVWNLVLLFWFDARLAVIATGLILFASTIVGASAFLKLRYQRRVSEIKGRISGLMLQLIDGIAKLRVAGAEVSAFSVWGREYAQQRVLRERAGNVANYVASFDAAFPIIAAGVVFANAIALPGERLSTGEFLAFNVAFTVYLHSFLRLVSAAISLLDVVPELERTQPILRTTPEVDQKNDHPGTLNGDIEVNQVSFRYTPDQPMVLEKVSFSIHANEFVAIVGPSGSGKSTLLRLLLGFEKPTSGAIYYSGQDLAGLDVREVRRQLGVVLQNGRIMAGTIRENVEAAKNLKKDDVWRALERAALADDVREMPMQLGTFVGPGGEGLSGGQRQRLLIARSIAADPRIVFLDEATSALDNATQAIVTASLHRIGVTRLVIAHRLSTIRDADRIIVLERGKIVQQGTYDELIQEDGTFKKLAERQLV